MTALCVLGFVVGRAQSTDTMTVYFDFNKSALRRQEQAALDRRFNAIGPRIGSIELAGHCDSVGRNHYNDSLARQRVATVRKYLLSKQVPDSVFTELYSYGKRKPINDNGDEQKRSLNRRVTIRWRLAEGPVSGSTLRDALRDTAAVVGKTIILPRVLFYRPMPVSFSTLQELSGIMKEHPGLRIEIQGHVCCMPGDMDGRDIETKKDDLSMQRAKFVYGYLASFGVDTTRMSYRGYGGSRKIYPEETNEAEKLSNRRVEIKILRW
jgi:outer membrane protein OmpA-like peptidoglycan-associated protein